MKICVFADIHGNWEAFKYAFKKIEIESADVNIFLGDLCGYYYDQIKIFSKLLKIQNLISVKGNHDKIFLRILNGDDKLRKEYLIKYGHSMENLLNLDHRDLKKWMSSIPDRFIDDKQRFHCYHGSPLNYSNGYLYPEADLGIFDVLPECFYFLGHTHYKMFKKVGKTLIVNPGSIGQPRDHSSPTYATINLLNRQIEFKEIWFDKKKLFDQIDKFNDSDKYLRKVLDRIPD
jgi:putative phosphoesterase